MLFQADKMDCCHSAVFEVFLDTIAACERNKNDLKAADSKRSLPSNDGLSKVVTLSRGAALIEAGCFRWIVSVRIHFSPTSAFVEVAIDFNPFLNFDKASNMFSAFFGLSSGVCSQ